MSHDTPPANLAVNTGSTCFIPSELGLAISRSQVLEGTAVRGSAHGDPLPGDDRLYLHPRPSLASRHLGGLPLAPSPPHLPLPTNPLPQEQAAWGVGNMAGDGPAAREALLAQGAAPALVHALKVALDNWL